MRRLYRLPIQIEICIANKEWESALYQLRNIPNSDEHLVGLKKKVYHEWAKNADDSKRSEIAINGLSVPYDPLLENNIFIIILSIRLARIAQNKEKYDYFMQKIKNISPDIEEKLIWSEDNLDMWET
ncbi:hypothetical protein [Candidatus Magnetobacterium casense]|uniref:hypothetical protein n=1 Tax=Candidatus Magnetobacterium casense TaxID=1455061 RepID=UPI00058B3E4F|nr:hypothetical protein [Candidatus Magnetobacterium casensis]